MRSGRGTQVSGAPPADGGCLNHALHNFKLTRHEDLAIPANGNRCGQLHAPVRRQNGCLPAKLPLFLNTHPNEPMLKSVVPQMRRLRDRVPRRPLVLEIHEGAIMEPGLVRELRAALSEFDVQLAFDDFGAGQARIRELICAPSDYIKFDAALIRDLQEVSGEQLQLFRSIIRGVKEEGAITVAEGVETEAMVDVCAEVGFDLVQGYAMSRPAIMYPALPDNPNDTATLP